MLRRCIQLVGLVSESKRNKQFTGPTSIDGGSEREDLGAPKSVDFSLQSTGDSKSGDFSLLSKNIFARIVHAGGREELYQTAVPASLLMEKYPGMCCARPDVFNNPHESILKPEESLMPGQKYYIIPYTTAQKIKHQKKAKAKEPVQGKEENPDGIVVDSGASGTDESTCSARDYYVSRERWSRRLRRKGIREKKPFVPPLPKTRSCRGLGWEPSLTSVQELSP